MIEFNCQHCGKLLRLNDTYAGRDGWCRVCKRMVIVPDGAHAPRIEDMPPEEGYARLQRLLQYAATKADQLKIHLAKQPKIDAPETRPDPKLEQTIAQQAGQIQGLQTQLNAVEAALDESKHHVASLEAAVAAANEARDLIEANFQALERQTQAERKQGEVRPESAFGQFEALRDGLDAAFRERDEVDSALEAIRKEHAVALNAALNERDQVREMLETLQLDHETALNAALRERDDIQAKLESITQGHSASLDAALAERDEARAALAAAKDEQGRLLSAALGERDVAQDALESTAEDHAEARTELIQERDGALARLKEAEASGNARIADLESQLASVRQKLEIAQGERDRLAEDLEDVAAGTDDSARLLLEKERAIRALQDDIALHKEMVAARDGQLRAIQAELDEARGAHEGLAGLGETNLALEKAHGETKAALEKLRNELKLAERKSAALEAGAKRAAEAEADRSIERDHLKRDLASRDEVIRKLSQELESLTATQTAAELERDKATRGLRAAESRVDGLGAELAAVQQQLERLTESKSAMEQQLGEAAGRAADLESEAIALRRELSQATDTIDGLQAALETSRQSYESNRAELDAATAEAAKHADTIRILETELETTREQVRQSAGEVSRERTQAEARVESLESEIARLNVALAGAQQAASKDTQAIASSIAEAEASAHAASEALEQAERNWDEEREKLNVYVAELQAELMNSGLALESAQAEAAESQRQRDALEEQYTVQARALAEAENSAVKDGGAIPDMADGGINGELEALRAENDALRDALAAYEEEQFGSFDEESGDDVIVLEARPPDGNGPKSAPRDPAAEKLRQQEKKDMMNVLSDFLNK